MASLNNSDATFAPEKVVIVTGPTFGTAMGFVLFGAVVGAAGALYLHGHLCCHEESGDVSEDVSAQAEAAEVQLIERLGHLAKRAKRLAIRVREAVHSAGEVIGPVISEAVQQARSGAREATQDLQQELEAAHKAATQSD